MGLLNGGLYRASFAKAKEVPRGVASKNPEFILDSYSAPTEGEPTVLALQSSIK